MREAASLSDSFSLLSRTTAVRKLAVPTYFAYTCAAKVAASCSVCPPVWPARIERVSVAWYTSERKLDARNTTAASTREMTRIRSQFCAMTRKCVARSMAGHVRGATSRNW